MLTGSMAMAVYSVPRMTRDIDLVIECQIQDSEKIAKLFEPDCYVDRHSVREAIAKHSIFNIIHNEWIIKADFIIRKNDEYRRHEFERRREYDLDGFTIFVVAPEDLILSKIKWTQETGSELQQRDVRTLINSIADLDWPYLQKWASMLDLQEILDQVRNR